MKKVKVFSPDIQQIQHFALITTGIGNFGVLLGIIHSFTVLSPLRGCRAFSAAEAIAIISILFHLVPIAAGWTEGCGFKACPRILHMTSTAGINPSPLDLGSNTLTTWPLQSITKFSTVIQ